MVAYAAFASRLNVRISLLSQGRRMAVFGAVNWSLMQRRSGSAVLLPAIFYEFWSAAGVGFFILSSPTNNVNLSRRMGWEARC